MNRQVAKRELSAEDTEDAEDAEKIPLSLFLCALCVLCVLCTPSFLRVLAGAGALLASLASWRFNPGAYWPCGSRVRR
jgi:hypothetical protein